MKQLFTYRANTRLLEKFIREISKGYYSDFSEYHPDHTKSDVFNDHSKENEINDHTHPFGSLKRKRVKKK